jgi:hypothetical protein
MVRLDNTEQSPAKVDDEQLGRLCGVRRDEVATDGPQGRSLAALTLSEKDEMRLFGEIDCYRL